MADATPKHPIRVVSRRTGLSAELIRAWEQRYAVVRPARTATGRRLYSDDDIERLQLLRLGVQGGRSIGQIARLASAELAALVASDAPPARAGRAAASTATPAERVMEGALAAVRELDGQALDTLLRSAALAYPPAQLIEKVLVPFMRQVGDAWHDGALSVAHEHLASAIVRSVVASLPRAGAHTGAPAIVVATPAGQWHEIGALVVAAAAAEEGLRVVYLGANTPARDIVAAARQVGARIVALSITWPDETGATAAELRAIRAALPDVAIVAGGRGAEPSRPALDAIGAVVLPDTLALRAALETFMAGAA